MPDRSELNRSEGRGPSDPRQDAPSRREYARRIDCAEGARSGRDEAYGRGRGAPDPESRGSFRRAV